MKKNNSKEIQHSDEDESGKICIGSTDKDRSIREKMMNECAEKQMRKWRHYVELFILMSSFKKPLNTYCGLIILRLLQ